MAGRVVVLINDLLLGSKIREALKAGGREATFVASRAGLEQALAAGGTDLVLADLALSGEDPIAALEAVHDADAGGPRPRVIGFYSHVDEETRKRALDAGIEDVLPRSAFFARLPELVRA